MVELFFKLAAVSVETSKRMLNFLPGVVIALRKASTVRARRAKTELIIVSSIALVRVGGSMLRLWVEI